MVRVMKRIHIVWFLLLAATNVSGQKTSIQLGTQIPLNYSVGVNHFLVPDKLSGQFQFGFLTKPYDAAILELMEYFGTDESIVNTIGEAFSFGMVFQPAFRYHWKKSYAGVAYSYYALSAKDAPFDAIQNYYGIYFPNISSSRSEITLHSDLHNAGIMYGRKFIFKNVPNIQVNFELSIQKTFTSGNNLVFSKFPNPERLNQLVDDELDHYYLTYGYLPSVNVFLVYKFSGE